MTITPYRIQGATGEWEVVMGLEVHARILSISGFCSGAKLTARLLMINLAP
jgi:aspartyl-tRNA(Asn)/glutamyl-tRNA(Gln) amidotransferase subunit B